MENDNVKLRFLLFCTLILAGILLVFLILSNIPNKADADNNMVLDIEVPEEILFEFTTGGVLKDNFKPQFFLKITDTDLSRCFINGRLRVNLNGEIYWIRLEK